MDDTNTVTLVTTFNHTLWERYARLCLRSWASHLPESIDVWVYDESGVGQSNGQQGKWPAHWEWQDPFEYAAYREFMNDHTTQNIQDYRRDVRRFAHKVFALGHASLHCRSEYLIWLDADVFIFEDIPADFFPSLFNGHFLFYLSRHAYTHSECGCWGMDTRLATRPFFPLALEALYRSGSVLDLPEQHDSFVFDWLRKRQESAGLITSHDLTPHVPKGHAWLASPLASYMDHWKGDRWKTFKSWQEDVSGMTGRGIKLNLTHPYWRNLPSRVGARK